MIENRNRYPTKWDSDIKCKDCKHRETWGIEGIWGYCNNPDVKELMSADEGPYSVSFEPPENFGCAYFQNSND